MGSFSIGDDRAFVILIELDELVEENCLLDGLKSRLSKETDPHLFGARTAVCGPKQNAELSICGRDEECADKD